MYVCSDDGNGRMNMLCKRRGKGVSNESDLQKCEERVRGRKKKRVRRERKEERSIFRNRKESKEKEVKDRNQGNQLGDELEFPCCFLITKKR